MFQSAQNVVLTGRLLDESLGLRHWVDVGNSGRLFHFGSVYTFHKMALDCVLTTDTLIGDFVFAFMLGELIF